MNTFLYKAPKKEVSQPIYIIFLISMLFLGMGRLNRFSMLGGIESLTIGIMCLILSLIMLSYYYQTVIRKHYFKVEEAALSLPSVYFNEHFKLTTPLTLGKSYKPFPYTVIRSFYIDQHEEETFISIILNTKPVFVFRYSKNWFQDQDFEDFVVALRDKIKEERL